jgi:hypothetical protein
VLLRWHFLFGQVKPGLCFFYIVAFGHLSIGVALDYLSNLLDLGRLRFLVLWNAGTDVEFLLGILAII